VNKSLAIQKTRQLHFLVTFIERNTPALTFFLVVLVLFPSIYFGLDSTDTAYFLTNQTLVNPLNLQFIKITPFWWFSDYLGALWLKIMGGYGLWGAKLGGVITYGLISMFAAKTLLKIYTNHWLILSSVAITAFFAQGSCLICHETIPPLLYILFSLYFLKLNRHPSTARYQIICGFILTLLFFSRMTSLLLFAILPICLFICYCFKTPTFKIYFRSYLTVFLISTSIIISFIIYTWSQNLLNDYLFFPTPTKEHELIKLLKLSAHQMISRWKYFAVLFGIPLTCSFAFKNPSSIYLFLSLIVLPLFFSFMPPNFNGLLGHTHFNFNLANSPDLLITFSFLSAFCIYKIKDLISFEELILFVMAVSMPLILSFGSASGLDKTYLGFWLLSGGTVLLLNKMLVIPNYKNCRIPIHLLSIALLIYMGVHGIKQIYFHAHRDSPHFSEWTMELKTPRLRRIFTSPARAESFDSLIAQIQKHAKPSDQILAYHHFPMIYYASETLPYGNHAWLELLTLSSLAKKIETFSEQLPPVLIVKTKIDPLNPHWGLKQIPRWSAQDDPDMGEKLKMLDELTATKWNSTLVWSNQDFDLYLTEKK
jgi:hypothetical protein